MESSSLASVGYEDEALEVRFRNGGVYRYFGVPDWLHRMLLKTESKGRFFNLAIRDRYRAEKLAPARRGFSRVR
ncbi:MAG TPA: KTSC domain-containing protein [Solirubrobacterales bacterium]|nr:KTSC domain-containing protein [Solirubrobacterales bacterium]